jgi:hypothetical protein
MLNANIPLLYKKLSGITRGFLAGRQLPRHTVNSATARCAPQPAVSRI